MKRSKEILEKYNHDALKASLEVLRKNYLKTTSFNGVKCEAEGDKIRLSLTQMRTLFDLMNTNFSYTVNNHLEVTSYSVSKDDYEHIMKHDPFDIKVKPKNDIQQTLLPKEALQNPKAIKFSGEKGLSGNQQYFLSKIMNVQEYADKYYLGQFTKKSIDRFHSLFDKTLTITTYNREGSNARHTSLFVKIDDTSTELFKSKLTSTQPTQSFTR